MYDSAVTELVDGGTLVQEEVLVQQADIFSSPISCSILVLWITSVAGDNRQAVERSGWYRTPIPLCETIWIISFCRLSVGRGLMRLGWGVVWLSLTLQVERVEHKAHPRLPLWVTASYFIPSIQYLSIFFLCCVPTFYSFTLKVFLFAFLIGCFTIDPECSV